MKSTAMRDAFMRAAEKVLTDTHPLAQPALVKRVVGVLERQGKR